VGIFDKVSAYELGDTPGGIKLLIIELLNPQNQTERKPQAFFCALELRDDRTYPQGPQCKVVVTLLPGQPTVNTFFIRSPYNYFLALLRDAR
jgi:hypothetical protein